MAQNNFNSVARTQVSAELFSQEDRPVLPSSATERDHQVGETATLVSGDRRINQRLGSREVLMHALLLIKVVNHWIVFPGKHFEAFFATWVGKTPRVEYISTAVTTVVGGHLMVEGEAEDTDCEGVRLGRKLLKLVRRKHALKSIHKRRKHYRQVDVMGQPAKVLKCIGHALQEMWFALVEAAKSVRPQRLHDAHIHVGVVVLHERSRDRLK